MESSQLSVLSFNPVERRSEPRPCAEAAHCGYKILLTLLMCWQFPWLFWTTIYSITKKKNTNQIFEIVLSQGYNPETPPATPVSLLQSGLFLREAPPNIVKATKEGVGRCRDSAEYSPRSPALAHTASASLPPWHTLPLTPCLAGNLRCRLLWSSCTLAF